MCSIVFLFLLCCSRVFCYITGQYNATRKYINTSWYASVTSADCTFSGTAAVAQWLERSPRERKVVGSIPDRVIPKTL